MSSPESSRTFEVIISRAFVDKAFRHRLVTDKASVIAEYTLSPDEIEAIHKIDADLLDKARKTASMVGVVHG